MISNEVESLEELSGNYGTLLTATGKIVADFRYYRFNDFLLVDIAAGLVHKFVDALRQYIIMDDVELEDVSRQFVHFAVEGPESSVLLKRVLGEPLPTQRFAVREVNWRENPVWWIRLDELVNPAYELILTANSEKPFVETLIAEGRDCGLVKVADEAYEILRLEQGIPVYGVDMSDKNNPVEAQLSHAYSLTKGCYVGQEVVSKATHIGGVPRLLGRVKLEGRKIPPRGARVIDQDQKEVGWVTSSGYSPGLDCSIALAYLKRDSFTPGARYQVEIRDSGLQSGQVVEKFL
jgi:folate-binding protein YgfZ